MPLIAHAASKTGAAACRGASQMLLWLLWLRRQRLRRMRRMANDGARDESPVLARPLIQPPVQRVGTILRLLRALDLVALTVRRHEIVRSMLTTVCQRDHVIE